jgi:predicted porin
MLSDPIGTSQAAGVAVRQAFPGIGQITLAYAPTMSCSKTQTAGCGGADTAAVEGDEGSGYSALLELSNVGISGLALEAGIVTQKKKIGSELSPTRDGQFMTAGVKYTTGPVTLGYNRKEYEFGGAASVVDTYSNANETRKQNDYGIAYTAGNVSYGAIYQVTSSNIATELDEKYKSIAVGYNLGAVAAKVNLGRHTDVGGAAGTDVDSLTLKLSTNF